ncbi:hypothetical protein [Roseateles cavernae]|uniref:hypothetical protein n=1 Tax=Roseateles cavernae TaxID=3153578 RepID=UPI0032E3D581
MKNVYTPVQVTALEAAKVQLDTAICLFLLNAHPGPIHSLIGAAQEVLKGLVAAHARAMGVQPPETHLDATELALRAMGTSRLNDVRNFLKHKIGCAESTVAISADMNMAWMLDCIHCLAALGEPATALVELHVDWAFEVHFRRTTFPADMAHEDILKELFSERGHPYGTVDETVLWLKAKLTEPRFQSVPDWFRHAVSAWPAKAVEPTRGQQLWDLKPPLRQLLAEQTDTKRPNG